MVSMQGEDDAWAATGDGDASGPMHEPITPMTDEEASLFRFIRYGTLPGRINPQQAVGEVDTRHIQPPDEGAEERRRWDGVA